MKLFDIIMWGIVAVLLIVLTGCAQPQMTNNTGECNITLTDQGGLVSCGGDLQFIENPPNMIVDAIIDPCGNDPDHRDEYLIIITGADRPHYFRLVNFHELRPGYHRTHDGQQCEFFIGYDGSIDWGSI
jgi:hypothetical protein